MNTASTKPVRLAVIGAGARGTFAYAPYALKSPGDLRIVAVAEPNDFRRKRFAEKYSLAPRDCYAAAEELLKNAEADAVLISSPDSAHYGQIIQALDLGWNILTEKPVSPRLDELEEIQARLEKSDSLFMICHVLRYTPFFRTLKRLLDEGAVGTLQCIQHNENVGYFHQAHSFVRGNWRNSVESSPMILAKCCHDMDILNWLVGTECRSLSSFGALGHFKAENSPKGAPERCIQGCPIVDGCPYSALRYLDKEDPNPMVRSFANVVVALADGQSLEDALRTGPYGRCVYRCDNDVVDHQTVNLHYAGGVDVAFTMAAFTDRCDRTIKLMGSHGEIRASMDDMEIELRQFRKEPRKMLPDEEAASGHGGGDEGLIRAFIDLMRDPDREAMRVTYRQGLAGHRMALAAETSRLSNGTVQNLDGRS